MTACRLHILGASGTGTSTLGRAMAGHWSVPFHDTDDYFWHPTEPPYTQARPQDERLTLMAQMFLPRRAWVLSGSMISWSDTVEPLFDLVVFLSLDPKVRLERLRLREANRYRAEAIAQGGAYHSGFLAFMDWAAAYDSPDFVGRSLTRHQAWLGTLTCPVLTLDAALPTAELVAQITAATPRPKA